MRKVNIMKFFRIVFQRSKDITSFIFLSLSYVIGVGLTSIIAKLLGKFFLNMKPEKTTWVVHHNDSLWEHMY